MQSRLTLVKLLLWGIHWKAILDLLHLGLLLTKPSQPIKTNTLENLLPDPSESSLNTVWFRQHSLTCTAELISAAKPPVTGASWLMSKRPVFTTDWKNKDTDRRLQKVQRSPPSWLQSNSALKLFGPHYQWNLKKGKLANSCTSEFNIVRRAK